VPIIKENDLTKSTRKQQFQLEVTKKYIASEIVTELWIIDAMMTGRDPRADQVSRQVRPDIDDLVASQTYTLSDGISGLRYYAEENKLILTRHATNPVLEKWHTDQIEIIRSVIERLCQEYTVLSQPDEE
jgi:hypothetical protein